MNDDKSKVRDAAWAALKRAEQERDRAAYRLALDAIEDDRSMQRDKDRFIAAEAAVKIAREAHGEACRA